MKLKVEFDDNRYFTADEAVTSLKMTFGDSAKISASPINNTPEDHIYFGLMNMVTTEQLDLYFEYNPHGYDDKVEELKANIMLLVSNILDRVIEDNEHKVNM